MNFTMFAHVLNLVPAIVTAVQAIELLVRGTKKGKEKQDAAVALIPVLLPVIEGFVEKDLLDDALVQVAVRNTIDAVVALDNVVRDAKARRAPSA